MTGVLALVVSGTIIAAATWWVCRRYYLTRYDLHTYRRVRLATLRVDVLYRDKDHHERLARRLTDEKAVLRDAVGPLLDTVAEQDATIARLTRRKPYSGFVYGAGRITRTRREVPA